MALRMKNSITYLIHDDQNGYIKGRSAAMVIRALDDIIEFTDHYGIPGAILSLDYKKAYDSLSKEFMFSCFERYGFGPNFQKWISVINEDTQSCISYCGWLSEWFMIERGIRQGCPLSPLCFILACALLACKIRQSTNIKGIPIPVVGGQVEVKIMQYADDSTILVNDERSIIETFKLIDNFSIFSGLVLNRNKTEAIWTGCWKFKRKKVCDITWKIHPDSEIKVLGIYFKNDCNIHENPRNIEPKFIKCENLIKSWRYRKLSILGRIQIAKSLLMSQFIYLMQATILPDQILTRINRLLFKFIWKNNDTYKENDLKNITEGVRRDIMIQCYDDQGLNMVDMTSMQMAFAINWITKLTDQSKGSWKLINKYFLDKLGQNLIVFKTNVPLDTMRGINKYRSYFSNQLIKTWASGPFQNKNANISNSAQILWNNCLFQYRGSVLYLERWIKHDILFVSDIIDQEGQVSYGKICQKIQDSHLTRFEFNSIRNALNNVDTDHVYPERDYSIYICDKKLAEYDTKQIRCIIQQSKKNIKIHLHLEGLNYSEIPLVWRLSFDTLKEPRISAMQWKILHNIYPTNCFLMRIGKSHSNICNACNIEIDSTCHFFFECSKIELLWTHIGNDIEVKIGKRLQLTKYHVILGIYDKQDFDIDNDDTTFVNALILLGKFVINKWRHSGQTMPIELIYEQGKKIRDI